MSTNSSKSTDSEEDPALAIAEQAREQLRSGKVAFERGNYRAAIEYLEKAVNLGERNSRLGGEAQVWLVTAYQAEGMQTEAIALCEQLGRHPDLKTRQQSRRILPILKAPKLRTRPEWLTEIPDLTQIEGADSEQAIAARYSAPAARPPKRKPPQPEPEAIDLSQVNTKDNGFIWVALLGIALTIGGLIWLS